MGPGCSGSHGQWTCNNTVKIISKCHINLLCVIKAVACLNTDRSNRSFQCQFQFLSSLLHLFQNHPVILSLATWSTCWPSVSPIFTVSYDDTFVVTSEIELLSPLAPILINAVLFFLQVQHKSVMGLMLYM